MSFVQTAEAKIRQQEHDNRERFFDDHDGFMYTASSFINGVFTINQSDARDIMKYLHLDLVKALTLHPHNGGTVAAPTGITMAVGDTIQVLSILEYRDSTHKDIDATGFAEWIKDPVATGFFSVSNGLVTGLLAGGPVEVFAKVGDFESEKLLITVV